MTKRHVVGRPVGSARPLQSVQPPRNELRPLQRLFVVAMSVAVAMWLPLMMDRHGSMHAMDWLRLGMGAVGLVAVLVAAVLQTRSP